VDARELSIPGVFEFVPRVFPDDRGTLTSPYQETAFTAATGHALFPVRQTNHSTSRRGVVRGVHFTATPPGGAKYVHCSRGRAVDVVVDLRAGSPTFGRWDSVVLDGARPSGIYIPVGLGHAFVALEDDTTIQYLLSTEYVAENELAVMVTDPDLALPLPSGLEPVLSERDRVAPTLAEALNRGLLPDYRMSLALEKSLYPVVADWAAT
jgi:5-epimerase